MPAAGRRRARSGNQPARDDMGHAIVQDSASRKLDGSSRAARLLLAELCALSGQDAAARPVLELQFGAVVTRTAVEDSPGGARLTISARLPAQRGQDYAWRGEGAQFGELDCMWHADEGCHIAVRRIALARLGDERSLMDAILETADMARAWHASMALDRPAAC